MTKDERAPTIDTDVLIVGAGPAGLVIGELLARAGIHCTILEAGPFVTDRRAIQRASALNLHPDGAEWEARLTGVKDAAADLPSAWTRVRAVGGRSLVWGGWCDRFVEETFADARAVGAPWPVSAEDLAPHYELVEGLFGVRPVPSCLNVIQAKLGIEVLPRRGALYTKRGVRSGLSLMRGVRRVIPSAVVSRILWGDRGDVRGVEFSDASGRRCSAHARIVVLCASPVETIRLILTEPPSAIADRAHLVGRGLVDHLVVSYLAISPRPVEIDMGLSSATFIPRFVNLPKGKQRSYIGGFSMTAQGPMSASGLGPGARAVFNLSAKEARDCSFYRVVALGDAMPHRDRFVELHASDTDKLGRRVPVVHQAWSDNDIRMTEDMMEAALSVTDAITPADSVIMPVRDARRHRALFHEAGGCAMGVDPETSVTDPACRVRGVSGLYVADASVFPTSGDRHPTLTILALAARTAQHIIDSRSRGDP